jgi:hypothetical protein
MPLYIKFTTKELGTRLVTSILGRKTRFRSSAASHFLLGEPTGPYNNHTDIAVKSAYFPPRFTFERSIRNTAVKGFNALDKRH